MTGPPPRGARGLVDLASARSFAERQRLLHRRRRHDFWRRCLLFSSLLLGMLMLAVLVSVEVSLALK
jgi:hypothetical protein